MSISKIFFSWTFRFFQKINFLHGIIHMIGFQNYVNLLESLTILMLNSTLNIFLPILPFSTSCLTHHHLPTTFCYLTVHNFPYPAWEKERKIWVFFFAILCTIFQLRHWIWPCTSVVLGTSKSWEVNKQFLLWYYLSIPF